MVDTVENGTARGRSTATAGAVGADACGETVERVVRGGST